MIPKIIHQSYQSGDHPYPRHWQRSWIENHLGWSYRFHTDADNRQLVSEHFPRFLDAFDAFPRGIMRADFARFLYLYCWGGVYADLDYACLRPMDRLVEQTPRVGVPVLPENGYYRYHNALLMSEAGNPFWLECAEQAVHYFQTSNNPQVEWLAGPFRLQTALESIRPVFSALSAEHVTPFDWFSFVPWGKPDEGIIELARRLRDSSLEAMGEAFPEAYALTFWDHRW